MASFAARAAEPWPFGSAAEKTLRGDIKGRALKWERDDRVMVCYGMVCYGRRWSKMVQDGRRWLKIVQDGLR